MKVNGQAIMLASQENLHSFLVKNGYEPERVAIEHNGNVVQRKHFQTLQLSDEDVIEIVNFVGGG